MPTPASITVELAIAVANADAQYVDEQTRLLRRDLEQQLGVVAESVPTTAPAGTRGAGELLGLLNLVLLPTLAPKLFDLLQTWLANRKDSTVKLKIAKDGVEVEFSPERTSAAELDAFLAAIRKHAQS